MELLGGLLPWIQIILSVILVVTIILQQSAASVGGAFGGGDGSAVINRTRRGAERTLFRATIVLAILFACSALLSFFTTPSTIPASGDIQIATSTATSTTSAK